MDIELGPYMSRAWLIPAIPLVSFLFMTLFVRSRSEKACGWIATLAVFSSCALSLLLAREYFAMFAPGAAHPMVVPWAIGWLPYMEGLTANLGVLVDPTSILLMVVVTSVSSMVHLYSLGYMKGEGGFGRYYIELNLFTFSMLGLVVAPNILQMFVFWELVGVSSFLLIGFYYQRSSAVAAAKKAFIVTRFADLGFLVGILILAFYSYSAFPDVASSMPVISGHAPQPLDFAVLNHPAMLAQINNSGSFLGLSILSLALLLVFVGAAGKSAMFPLHIWLPDAMEGPTPVSALIHAATMVVAGVYLVARLFPAFAFAGDPLVVVAIVGAFTCLFAAVIACTQSDIKRVLAFSTLSQLGYMMFSLGVATADHPLGHTAALFHLFTHAFFKSLLFLGAGALIHAVHSNEIWDMGGLRSRMPITHIVFLIATLAIAGIWPFAGFFSKDEILRAAHEGNNTVVYIVGLLVAVLTAFYMFRIYFVSFWGTPRSEGANRAHEAPPVMLVPLLILAALSIVAGFVPMADYVGLSLSVAQGAAHSVDHSAGVHAAGAHEGIHWNIAIPATLAGLLGIAGAMLLYLGGSNRAASLSRAFGALYVLVRNKFYIDEIYLFVTKSILFRLVARPVAWFDRHIVDGAVNLFGWVARIAGMLLALLQTGQVQTYAAWSVTGVGVLLALLWFGFGRS
jgi:NADH-quinone oxidoreductase subunit L